MRPAQRLQAGLFAGPATLLATLLATLPSVSAEPSALPAPLPVIEAGSIVEDADRDRWNRVVLRATPRFASGDVADVSEAIKSTVSRFTFVVLATVRPVAPSQAGGDAPRYRLADVGVGYAMPVNDRLTVIAPDARVPGATLDFLGRQVLSAKQKSLAEIACVGRHDLAMVFDVPTLMRRGDEHEELVVRHFVRIDPRSGECSTCAWAIADDDGVLKPLEEPLRIIAGGTAEERPIHVDGSRFTFGFPTKQAFAVEELPPGRPVDWSTTLRTAADHPVYTPPALERLAAELDTAVASLRTLRAADRSRPLD